MVNSILHNYPLTKIKITLNKPMHNKEEVIPKATSFHSQKGYKSYFGVLFAPDQNIYCLYYI